MSFLPTSTKVNNPNVIALLFLTLLGVSSYWGTFDVIIPTDFYYFANVCDNYGLGGVRYNFFNIALHTFTDLVFCLIYYLFGVEAVGWRITTLSLHILNAWLLYILLIRINPSRLNGNFRFLVPVVASALFLISPYQTEAVLWGATLSYLLSTAFLLLSLIVLLNYFHSRSTWYIVPFHLLFIASLFSNELTLVFPLIGLLFWLTMAKIYNRPVAIRKYIYLIFGIQTIALLSYFLINKLWLGSWIGHYGANTHLNFSVPLLFSAFTQYLLKFATLFRYLPSALQQHFWQVFATSFWVVSSATIVFAVAIIIGAVRKCSSKRYLILFFSIGFAISLVPVINLDTSFMHNTQADRYGYLASIFFYPAITLILVALLRKSSIWPLTALVTIQIVCLRITLPAWISASDVSAQLIQNYKPWLQEKNVYILNMPDNYKGVYLFRSNFYEAIQLKYGQDISDSMNIVAWYNINTKMDSVKGEINPPDVIVEIGSWGTWFWRGGMGAVSYKSEQFEVTFHEVWYVLHFYKWPENAVFLYQVGDQWRSLYQASERPNRDNVYH